MKQISLLLLLTFLSCQKETLNAIQMGNWGAEQARLNVSLESWYVELGCAHVIIQNPIQETKGVFEMDAEFYQEFGVIYEGQEFFPKPAKVSGKFLKNGDLELTFLVGEDKADYGTFTFVYNQEAMIYKCA
jgi:hypothetical protein